jgi:hypothetical protein
MRAVPVALALLAVVVTAPSGVRAQLDDGAALPPDRVTVTRRGAMVVFAARYQVRIEDDGRFGVAHPLALPRRGAVTAASVTHDGTTRRLVLTEAEAAAARVDAVRSAPAGPRRTTVVELTSSQPGHAWISLIAPRPATLTLDLTLEAPTCFVADRRLVGIPAGWVAALDSRTRHREVASDRAKELAGVCGELERDLTWLALPTAELSRRRAGDRIGVRASRFVHAGRAATRIELAIAGEMSAIPADLHTAIVVDGSGSLSDAQRASQRAIVASYLRAVPRSRVQLIHYARRATAALPRWRSATAAAPEIERALDRLIPANGSAVDAGLREAGAWLARVRGTRRIIVFTDELVAAQLAELAPSALIALVPAGTLIHVVAIDDASTPLVRDDDTRFADLAATSAGIAVRAGGTAVDALELARPIRIDQLRIRAPGLAPAGRGCLPLDAGEDTEPGDLDEGRSCAWSAIGEASADRVSLIGQIWGRAWTRDVALAGVDPIEAARDLIAGGHATTDADDALLEAAHAAAGTVNERWTLLATWGGTDGYADQVGGGGAGWGTVCSCDGLGTIGHGTGTGSGYALDDDLRPQLEPLLAACHAPGATLALALETTRHEIVAVEATVTGIDDAATIASCVEEAVWDAPLRLTTPLPHRSWTLAFALR